jgi:hypothetical protein
VRWGLVAPVVVGIFVVLVAASVFAQPADDLDEAPADSVDQDSPEDIDTDETDDMYDDDAGDIDEDTDDTELERPRRRGSQKAARDSLARQGWSSWLLNTRPNVQLKVDRKKDVTNWDTKIKLNRRVSSKLRFNLAATLHTQENSTLNRSDSNDGTSAGLSYQLSDAIGFSLKYNSTVTAYRYNLKKAEPAERRRRQNVSVSADFNKDLNDILGVHLKTSAGTTQNSYASVSNEGSQQDLAAGLNITPMDNLRASISYNAKRLLLDSQVDSSGTSVFSSEDRTFSQDLGLSVKYDVVPGVKISIDASHVDDEKQNPDPNLKKQETENRTSSRVGVSTSFDLLGWATWSVAGNLSEGRARYVLQSSRNNSVKSSDLKVSAKVTPWSGATVNVGGTREETRSEYENPDTGRDTHNSVSLQISQSLGQKADIDLTALSDIASVFYDDKEENPKDRDRMNNRISMNLAYRPLTNIKTTLAGEYSEDKTRYIKAERSATNRTNRRYRLSGDYDLTTFRNISIHQSYDISALYAIYQYTEGNNTLVRNSNIRTQFTIPLTSNLGLNLNHNYQFQDQGKYSERGGKGFYARSSEKETHTITMVCRYSPISHMDVIVRQTYRVQTNWSYREGEKILAYEVATSDISGRISFSYDVGETTKFSLKLEQNLKEGSNVSQAFRKYRNIELEASHIF